MKLLSAIVESAAENCVVLTYNADLLFFEQMLFERMYAAGCRNFVVLCDPARYQDALADAAALRYAGQRYAVAPARTSPAGAFHPKVFLLTSRDRGHLFLGSGNLSRPGMMRNWEVVTRLSFSPDDEDPSAWIACHWAYDLVERITARSDPGGIVRARLEQMRASTPWLSLEPPAPPADTQMLHNLDVPLLDQVITLYRARDGTPVVRATVVSPFYDSGARAVARLMDLLSPQALNLYVYGSDHGLTQPALDRALADHGTDCRVLALGTDPRALHAKVVLLQTERAAWLVSGSANFTLPAWLRAAEFGNTETVIVRHVPNPTHFDAWLALLTATSEPAYLECSERPDVPARPNRDGPELLGAFARDGGNIDLAFAAPPDGKVSVELAVETTVVLACDAVGGSEGLAYRANVAGRPTPGSSRPILVRAIIDAHQRRAFSNAVLLHDVAALTQFTRPAERSDRRHAPNWILPESQEQCAEMLERLDGLLVLTSKVLRERRPGTGGSVAPVETGGTETDVPAYDPAEHIVDEVQRGAGNIFHLHASYDHWLTYESVLRAAIAVVESLGQSALPVLPQPRPSDPAGGSDRPTEQDPGDPDEEAQRQRVLARVAKGFKRLVRRFEEASRDAEYVAEVPLRYLHEVLSIILTYVRVAWRDDKLTDDLFAELSQTLLVAWWGLPKQPGFWEKTAVRRNQADVGKMRDARERLHLEQETWLHAYAMQLALTDKPDAQLLELAACLRRFVKLTGSARCLGTLPEASYARVWRLNMPVGQPPIPAARVDVELKFLCDRYDDRWLRREIDALCPEKPPEMRIQNVRGRNVPTLQATIPFDDGWLDELLRIFQAFLTQPTIKDAAWVCFLNGNPVGAGELKKLIASYSTAQQRLLFVGERVGKGGRDGSPSPDIERYGVPLELVAAATSVADLVDL